MPVIFKTLDVRRMLAKGVEPLPEIRKRVAALEPNQGLTVVAPFLPSPLIELLKSEGFEARIARQPDGAWAVQFSRDVA